MVAYGADIDLPVDASSIEINATTDTVRGALDDLLGLGAYDVEQYGGARERLAASVSHAIQFCLQAQTELMSPTHLFHRGGEANVAPDFPELFPYFIGAIDEDLVAARRLAAQLRRQLRDAQRRLDRLKAQVQTDENRDRLLVEQSIAYALISPDEAEDDPRQVLTRVVQGPLRTAPTTTRSQTVAELRASVARSRSIVRELRERRAALNQLDRDRDAHASAVHTQLGRLGIRKAIDETVDVACDVCPACGTELHQPDDTLADLARDAAELDLQLQAMGAATRDIGPAERELDQAILTASDAYTRHRERLDAALAADSTSARMAEEGQLQARLLGVIEEYLRGATTAGTTARAALSDRVRSLTEQLQAVTAGTANANVDEELEARLAAMSVDMTRWARSLELEAADEGNVYIDRRLLNVAIGTSHGRIGLAQMGSGANHVGYHLVAHLGLHQHFVRELRPVPRFVVFDQPSLPFFPTNTPDRDAAVNDVDWASVRAMMRLSDDVARELDGALQVIITDHASFAGEDWFDDALVEDWHTGMKLVPDEWPEQD